MTVCFETAFSPEKYIELREEAQNRGYRAEIITIEVESHLLFQQRVSKPF